MIIEFFQYAFIAPVQQGDDYSEYDMNRYKNCFYVGMFRGIYLSLETHALTSAMEDFVAGWHQMAITRA